MPRYRLVEKINVSAQIHSLLATALASGVDVEDDDNESSVLVESRTQLDSHANMPVVGQHAYVISDTGKVAEVNAFTPDYEPLRVPIVDAAVRYDCPYGGESYILVIRNALHVPAMRNNLLPPFMMREAGIQVNEVPKMQQSNPSVDDHSICFPETSFRIPLLLWGTFSYFPTSKPTATLMKESEEVYMLTPSRWNPHCDSYATNEENMLDWEGNMVEKRDREQIILSEIQEDAVLSASVQVSSIESKTIDTVLVERSELENKGKRPEPCYQHVPAEADQVSSVLAEVSPLLNDRVLYDRMKVQSDIGMFKTAIGSTNATDNKFLVETVTEDEESDDEYEIVDADEGYLTDEEEDKQMLDDLFSRAQAGEIYCKRIVRKVIVLKIVIIYVGSAHLEVRTARDFSHERLFATRNKQTLREALTMDVDNGR